MTDKLLVLVVITKARLESQSIRRVFNYLGLVVIIHGTWDLHLYLTWVLFYILYCGFVLYLTEHKVIF